MIHISYALRLKSIVLNILQLEMPSVYDIEMD
jgi:hypothetical protein